MGFWVVLGTDEWTVRLPSAVCGILTVLVTYALGVALFEVRTGLVAALLVALSPFQLWYAQEARPYALLMLLSTLSLLGFVKWLQEEKALWGWAWLLATGLAILTFLPAAYLMLGQGLFLILTWRRCGGQYRARLRRPAVVLPAVIIVGGLMPLLANGLRYFATALATPETVFGNLRPVSLGAIPYTFFAFSAGFSVGPTVAELHLPDLLGQVSQHLGSILLYGVVFATLFSVGCRRLASDRTPLLLLMLSLTVPIGVMLGLAAVTSHAYNVRYVAPALIPYLLIVARGLTPAGIGPPPKSGGLTHLRWDTVGLVLCVILLLGTLYGYYFNPTYAKVDSREVARVIAAGEQPGDIILLSFSANPGALRCYYLGALPVRVLHWRRQATPSIEARLQEVITSHHRAWLVALHPWLPGHEGGVPPRLAGAYAVGARWDFAGARVMLLERFSRPTKETKP
jgi:uncharacterized membrane protein